MGKIFKKSSVKSSVFSPKTAEDWQLNSLPRPRQTEERILWPRPRQNRHSSAEPRPRLRTRSITDLNRLFGQTEYLMRSLLPSGTVTLIIQSVALKWRLQYAILQTYRWSPISSQYIHHELMSPSLRDKTHLFNSFFYKALTQPIKKDTKNDPAAKRMTNSEKMHQQVCPSSSYIWPVPCIYCY
jgi:hypothetical protein